MMRNEKIQCIVYDMYYYMLYVYKYTPSNFSSSLSESSRFILKLKEFSIELNTFNDTNNYSMIYIYIVFSDSNFNLGLILKDLGLIHAPTSTST